MSKAPVGPPDGIEPEAFWERVDQLGGQGYPRITAVRIARREALGHHPEDQVRARAKGEPKLRTHPETAELRKRMIESQK